LSPSENIALNNYAKIFQSSGEYSKENLERHIDRFRDLDKMLPSSSSTFHLISNTDTGGIEFISKNFSRVTGLEPKDFLEGGAAAYMSRIHPGELHLWLRLMADLMQFYETNYSASDLKRLDFQYNYRFKTGSGKFSNLIVNQVNLLADKKGKPVVNIGSFTLLGSNEHLPVCASVRYLNRKNQYVSVFTKNYNPERIIESITSRERDVVRLLSMGFSNLEIATKLCISHHTVKTHRKNLMAKTGARNSIALVATFVKKGLI
jgi:DNA-binding CsgD family transcriptional regulator